MAIGRESEEKLKMKSEKNNVIFSIRPHQCRDMQLQDYEAAGAFEEYSTQSQNNYRKTTDSLKALACTKRHFRLPKISDSR
jgi:hypothetical protein